MEVLNEIRAERVAQNRKWGQQDHNPVEWIAILTEEVGEAAKEAVDFHFENDLDNNISRIERNNIQYERLIAYRKECIQVAAVAVQMVESVDRYLEDTIVP